MDESINNVVSIDGDAIRRIREEKRLTQLYVAKVVGVTTDTVSRWENNRYPSIRRDNAVRLAEALEVEVEQILKNEVASEALQTQPLAVRFRFLFIPLAVLLLACICALVWFFVVLPAKKMEVVRILPAYAAPESRILIQVHLVAEEQIKGLILKESFPDGWQLIDASPKVSAIDSDTNTARWIFRNAADEFHVYYLVQLPADMGSVSDSITGSVVLSSDQRHRSQAVKQVGTMSLAPLLWIDGDGNSIIDDMEILDLSVLSEEAVGLDLDWERIEAFWQAGGYHWSPAEHRFVAGRPASAVDSQNKHSH